MFRRFSVNFALFSIGLDALVICLALALSARLRPLLYFLPFAADYPLFIPLPALIYPIFAIEWVGILVLFSVYDPRRNLRGINEFASLTLGTILATVALAGTLYLSFREVSRLLFLSFIVMGYILMLGWRAAFRLTQHLRSDQSRARRRVLIIGAGNVGRELQKQIQANPQLGLTVAGFLDDSPEKRAANPDILGTLSSAQSVVLERQIHDVVIALPQSAYKRINQLVVELHRLPVKVWVIPDYFRLALHKAAVEEFAGLPMLDLRAPALSEQQRLIKRAFDLLFTLLTLPVLLPLMGLIAIAIYLESPGPMIFRQPRVGENGRLFEMLKFRTMLPQAEALRHVVERVDEQGHLIHKTADDPRVTRVGRILRRTSLDELPQLFNVLKGEMSLVGPRPELPYLVERYELWQRQRFAVPQGITGWWQVNGRSNKPMHLNTEDDLYYVQNYSILLDIYILIKTIGVVAAGRGAF
jgi:exopolysaccharide biosynthesis polyprenyl glycosylphosphotransferase